MLPSIERDNPLGNNGASGFLWWDALALPVGEKA
jgi:hypothetical protein